MNQNNQKLTLHETVMKTEMLEEESFSQFIKYYRTHSRLGKKMTTKDLAKEVGIAPEIFRKIINMQKPTKKRDCILAICAVLKMNVEEANETLSRYHSMLLLNEDSHRDALFMMILNGQQDYYLDLETINLILNANDCDSLDLITSRGISKRFTTDTPYHVMDAKASTSLKNKCFHYRSLSSHYDINNYQFQASMHLQYDHQDHYLKIIQEETSTFYQDGSAISHSLEETGPYKLAFLQMLWMIKKETENMKQFLNDTINYKKRINAKVIGQQLYFYYETYDYDFPELHEYYLMEYIEGHFRLSISHESQFMSKHLENYPDSYHHLPEKPYVSYDSLEEIENDIQPYDESYRNTLLRIRKKRFAEMRQDILETIQDIKNKKISIYDIAELDDSIYHYYGIEEQVDNLLLCHQPSHPLHLLYHNKTILLNLKEIRRAFELGFKKLDDLLAVKAQYGDIEKILDLLPASSQ